MTFSHLTTGFSRSGFLILVLIHVGTFIRTKHSWLCPRSTSSLITEGIFQEFIRFKLRDFLTIKLYGCRSSNFVAVIEKTIIEKTPR
jgi:hypothetical protein